MATALVYTPAAVWPRPPAQHPQHLGNGRGRSPWDRGEDERDERLLGNHEAVSLVVGGRRRCARKPVTPV